MKNKPRILYISHGGGPMPLLGEESHQEMVKTLKEIAHKLDKPSAIILISAHWEEAIATVNSGANPDLYYDYYGFPEEAYRITYPSPGEPALASTICDLLNKSGVPSQLNTQRGFDHGMFVPLKIMYPDADIPCVQLSLINSLDPGSHIAMGKALQALDYDNLLIIGSGFSFHNMNVFFAPETPELKALNTSFEAWLLATCSDASIDEQQRYQKFLQWSDAPGARFCHPREEHLLPLHVCYGVAQRPCSERFELQIANKKSSMYLW